MKINLVSFLLSSFFLVTMCGICLGQTSDNTAKTPDNFPSLTTAQLEAFKSIRTESEKKAAAYGLQLAVATKQIYGNMMSDKEDNKLRRKLSKQMNEAVVGILAVKGQSIREMLKVLTVEQRQLVKNEMQKPDAPSDLSEIIVRLFKIPAK